MTTQQYHCFSISKEISMRNKLRYIFAALVLCSSILLVLLSESPSADTKACPDTKFNSGPYFSQYYEDYVLASVFHNTTKGFYIDVGVNDPNKNNTTKYFHDLGWSGMNIEPQQDFYDMLIKVRPNDLNYHVALSDKQGIETFYVPKSSRPCATLERGNSALADNIEQIKVRVTTLNDLLDQNKITNIDILKIDVEGHEHAVLKGIDLKKFRPKVIVVEIISPYEFHGYLKSEPILLANGYELGMSDDLNRYYYAKEHPQFAAKFAKINKCVILDKVSRNAYCPNKKHCKF